MIQKDWDKTRNVRQLHVFSERVGPNRPVDYFKLFYSDHAEITRFTNLNTATKRARGDKGVWTDVTADEIKAYFGILIIMDQSFHLKPVAAEIRRLHFTLPPATFYVSRIKNA